MLGPAGCVRGTKKAASYIIFFLCYHEEPNLDAAGWQ